MRIDLLYDKANFAKAEGKLNEAIKIYEKLLKISPDHFAALNNLATIFIDQQLTDKGLSLLIKANKLSPNNAIILNNLGNCYLQKDQISKALIVLRQAYKVDPDYIEAAANYANVLSISGQSALSESIFEKIRSRHIGFDGKVTKLEFSHHLRNANFVDAKKCLTESQKHVGIIDHFFDWIALFKASNDLEAAKQYILLLRELDFPLFSYLLSVEGYKELGFSNLYTSQCGLITRITKKANTSELHHWRDTLAMYNGATTWILKWIDACFVGNSPSAAKIVYGLLKQSDKLKPEFQTIKAWITYSSDGDTSYALKQFTKICSKDADNLSAQSGLACSAYWEKNYPLVERTIAILKEKQFPLPIEMTSYFMHKGDLTTAWSIYTSSTKREAIVCDYDQASAFNFSDKNIYICNEQGIGDEVMFLSCLQDLINLNPKSLNLSVTKRLNDIAKRSFNPNVIIEISKKWKKNELPKNSIVLRAGDLPFYFRNHIDSFPAHNGYLKPNPSLLKTWQLKLLELDNVLKVGIAWKGGAKGIFNSLKSTQLKSWLPLFQLPNVQFINLQYGDVRKEIESVNKQLDRPIVNFDSIDPIAEIESQLALIANLDLVIQVSNASIHFAGAVNTPAWLVSRSPADFRWIKRDETGKSAWYPSVTILDFDRALSIDELILQIKRRLALYLEGYTPNLPESH